MHELGKLTNGGGAVPSKGLVVLLAVLSISVLCSGLSMSGFIMHETYFDFENGGFEGFIFDTEIGIELSFSQWTTGLFIDLESDGWEDLEIFSAGSLGAFDIFSWFEFYAIGGGNLMPGEMVQTWDTIVQLELGGVNLWGVFAMLVGDSGVLHDSGTGSAFGFHAQEGVIDIYGEVSFNLHPFVPWVVWNGMDVVLSRLQGCTLIMLEDVTCAMTFTNADVFVLFPIGCADVGTRLTFDPLGFRAFHVWTEDLRTPFTWLTIELVDIWYMKNEKIFDISLGFNLGEAWCITPYLGIDQSEASVTAIRLDGLGLVCQLEDVTFIASALGNQTDFYIGEDVRIHQANQGFSHGYPLFFDCIKPMYGTEFAVGIETGGESCCSTNRLGVYAYFGPSTGSPLFDLREFRFLYTHEITEKLAWSLEAFADYDEFEGIEVTLYYTWGDVKIVSADESCCIFVP